MRYLLLAGLLLGIGCSNEHQPTAAAQVIPLPKGQPAPAFRLQAASGPPVALSDLRGKVVYLDFWGYLVPALYAGDD